MGETREKRYSGVTARGPSGSSATREIRRSPAALRRGCTDMKSPPLFIQFFSLLSVISALARSAARTGGASLEKKRTRILLKKGQQGNVLVKHNSNSKMSEAISRATVHGEGERERAEKISRNPPKRCDWRNATQTDRFHIDVDREIQVDRRVCPRAARRHRARCDGAKHAGNNNSSRTTTAR